MMDDTVTASVLARFLGVSTRRVRELADSGLVVRASQTGRYRLEESVRRVVEDMRRSIAGHGGAAVAASAARERGRLAAAKAEAEELKIARLRGSLLDAVAVEREWTAILTGVRARMLAVPSRAAQRLPHLSAHDVGEIDREIRDGLAELGHGNQ
jgi:phage terminase Nu1 subunit (DNA packaging protein)